jgi:hypothetical protein
VKTFEFAGQTYPSLKKLAAAAGVNYGALKHRIARGWDLDRALETPVKEVQATKQRLRPKYRYKGKLYSLKQLPTDLSYPILYYRIVMKGWSVKDAVETPHRSQLKHRVKITPGAVVPKNWMDRRSMAGCEHTNFDFDTKTRRCRLCGAGGGV